MQEPIELFAIRPNVSRAMARRWCSVVLLLAIRIAKKSLYPVSWIAGLLFFYGRWLVAAVLVADIVPIVHYYQLGSWTDVIGCIWLGLEWLAGLWVLWAASWLYARVNYPSEYRAMRRNWQ